MKKIIPIVAIIIFSAGCASTKNTYSVSSIHTEMPARSGVILSARDVDIGDLDPDMLPVGGAAVLSTMIVRSLASGSVASKNVKAVAAGLIVGAAAHLLTKKEYVEVVIRLNSGNTTALISEKNKEYVVGKAVTLIGSGNQTYITN